ncbi:zinc-dependent metalloprotease [Catalinimonas niigatensis]|uniref:zinc-dependent metalloprotease n=1 Tax=Catalinimonas niigatensis TaxID=1397264 RepID=UPI0026658896|nr:zinc-dependent metalloprotease [Catalinimonas niigatensis]WPP48568.1 zinc-dependent metalloprotease [Catalinimonas niigatensis]
MKHYVLLCMAALCLAFTSFAADEDTISEKTKDMEKYEGYFTFYWDEEEGKIWLEIDKFDTDFLYYNALSAGAGSNDIGLDRGRLNRSQVMQFRRSGPKILFVEPNQDYRAITDDPDEKRAVKESFAEAVMFGFKVEAEEEGKVLVDATDFFLDDAVGVKDMIKQTKQGSFSLDKSRSAIYLPLTKNFPKNTEFEVTLTFTGSDAGAYLRSVSPNPDAFTVRQHHSFVELPDDEYEPRAFDPRAGYGSIQYMDYATDVDQPIMQRFIRRHRLKKKDPTAAVSEAVEPIIYYLDPGAPEPIRSALMDGIRWWNQAYEAAGYKDAFQVKLLPEDADPMDIRYNYVQWVHRSTRGWSYGSSIYDPRTGEIIKGKVTLGSLRVRQDFLIASGLIAAYEEGKPVSEEMMQMSLQRIRQLGAHEVGHTLGISHNYASTYEGRHSVMDYPHPLVKIKNNNELDLSDAYTNEIGAWDKVAIAYGYQDFPEGVDEEEALNEIIRESISNKLLFISDRDARAESGAHPYAHLWDNGTDATEELKRVMQVRRIALNNISEKKLPFGQPMATLEEVLVPIYMFHRYQVEATAKLIGGLNYTYALRGDGQTPLEVVAGDKQRAAIAALLETIHPGALLIPEQVLELIPPYPLGYYENDREVFHSRTGLTFDPIGAAESAANFSLGLMFNHERVTRMIDLASRYEDVPGFTDMANDLIKATISARKQQGYAGELQRLVDRLVLDHFIQLASNANASGQARALATLKVNDIKQLIESNNVGEVNENWKAHYAFALAQIRRFENNPEDVKITDPLAAPDGSPIGQDALEMIGSGTEDWCGFTY